MFRSKLNLSRSDLSRFQVSILVLVDVSLEACSFFLHSLNEEFQSLFSWMFRSKRDGGRYNTRRDGVSILVLVDVSLEACEFSGRVCEAFRCFNPCSRGCFARRKEICPPALCGTSFNPCSRGCFARSMEIVNLTREESEFQSLFSWMFRSKDGANRSRSFCMKFQSLFSWMFRSKQRYVPFSPSTFRVSILVLVDVSLEDGEPDQFEGLLRSFNPCSRGCFARRTNMV